MRRLAYQPSQNLSAAALVCTAKGLHLCSHLFWSAAVSSRGGQLRLHAELPDRPASLPLVLLGLWLLSIWGGLWRRSSRTWIADGTQQRLSLSGAAPSLWGRHSARSGYGKTAAEAVSSQPAQHVETCQWTVQGAINFAVCSSGASAVTLCLFTPEDLQAGRVSREVELDPQCTALALSGTCWCPSWSRGYCMVCCLSCSSVLFCVLEPKVSLHVWRRIQGGWAPPGGLSGPST